MRLALIADEITAAGWRLTGAHVQIPAARSVSECFREAAMGADLVLITAEVAARLPTEQLDAALHSAQPLTLVIPDLLHALEPADIEDEVHRALRVAL